MNIGIDFDDTLTLAPAIWRELRSACIREGTQMYCISCRRNTSENYDMINAWLDEHDMQMPIILTGPGSKQDYVDKMDLKIDVWIDDMPRSIIEGR